MARILKPGGKSQEHQRLVLGGKGGIGKTQLAIAYANHHRDDYKSVRWLNAASEATLKDSLQLIAVRIFDVQEHGILGGNPIRESIHQWLSDRENTQWLLIFAVRYSKLLSSRFSWCHCHYYTTARPCRWQGGPHGASRAH